MPLHIRLEKICRGKSFYYDGREIIYDNLQIDDNLLIDFLSAVVGLQASTLSLSHFSSSSSERICSCLHFVLQNAMFPLQNKSLKTMNLKQWL